MIEALLRRSPYLNLYQLGDLDDFFAPYTRWFTDGESVALIYEAPEMPVLLALEEEGRGQALLRSLTLPDRFYAHVSPHLRHLLPPGESHGRHWRMGWTRRKALLPVSPSARRLGAADVPALERLYGIAYPGNWFDRRMIETGRYFGIDGVAVAGVHVYSERYRVAALGNVAVHPDHRGRGHGRAVVSALLADLAAIEHVGLNVAEENGAAIRLYESLGFERLHLYEEWLVTSP